MEQKRPTANTGILLIAGSAYALITAPAAAQVDTSDWECQYCPFQSGYEADVVAGADYVSDDAYRFGNARGYDEKGAYLALGGQGRYASDGYDLNWYAEDLGLDSRVFTIDGGRQGKFGFNLGYSELPYRLFDTTSTVFSPSGGDTLSLPGNWVSASQTSGFTALDESLQPVGIGSDRQTLEAGAEFSASSSFSAFVDYRHQQRDGIDIVSGANFAQASLLPRLLDFETDLVDAGIDYRGERLNLSLAWFGSFFKNNADSLTWDNPFTPFPGAGQGRLAQEPDNEFQQVSLSGAYMANWLDTVVAFSAAMGQGEQTETLLPYTINPTLPAQPLPRSSLDGKVDTTNYALTLTSRPTPQSRVKLAYRYDERNNKTAVASWTPVVVDSFPAAGGGETNTPYSFERGRLSLSGMYRFGGGLRLSAGYDRTELERDFQEVAEQTEDTGWGRIDMTPAGWLDISAEAGTSRREIDRYDTGVAATFGQNPLLRKYNMAYRYRNFGELMLSVAPAGSSYTFTLATLLSNDDYSKSEIGLTESDSLHVSADLSYAFGERSSLYLTGGYEVIDAQQNGSASFSTVTWQAVHRDRFDHMGAGMKLAGLTENIDLTLDYLRSEGTTGINMIQGGGNNPFPDLSSELDSVNLNLRYRRSERLDIDVSMRFESFQARDWAIENVEPDTISAVLGLGADPYDYDVWVAGISFRYRIGVESNSSDN